MAEVYGFACWHKSRDESTAAIINAQTRSKARYQYYLDISEPWPDVKLMDINVRKVGGARPSNTFLHVAELRGMPDLRPGERITSGYGDGVIVDAGSGANFVILFDSGRYSGQRLLVHPSEFRRLAQTVGAKP